MSEPVWSSRLDGRYDVVVVGNPENTHSGMLLISEGDRVLLEEVVGLSYGAIFGPDVADIAAWQQRAVEFIDGGGGAP